MSYSFRNPISPNQVNSTQTVDSSKIFGTDISVLGTGGYMEVFNLSDLEFTIPIGETGTIVYSGNSIPVNFFKGNGSAYSPDVLILGSDNMTSGRRRLGMLVYVHETDQIYQLLPSNYESLWNSATGATGIGGNTVVVSDFGTTIKNNSAAGQNFINIWTASTVEDVSGTTRSTASWKKYYGSDKSLTGGTFNSFTGTLNMSDILGLTVPISGFTSGGGSTGLTPSDYVVQGKLSANQSISANTDVIIQFVDDFDPQNWWNSSTYQLTPTIAGYYNIFVGVWLDNPGVTNNQANIQVRKNGNSFVIVQNPLNNVTGQAFEASKIVYLNGTTDYIEFTIFQGSTGSVNILQGTANGSGTWFSASLIVGGNSAFTGGGTTNYVSKWTSSSSLGNSQIFDNGTSVGFGTSSPSSSSIVDLTSSSKGFLPPRMTESQRNAISSPTIGLMVYQTNGSDGVYVYKASGWVQMI
jgi:hypothetical protein